MSPVGARGLVFEINYISIEQRRADRMINSIPQTPINYFFPHYISFLSRSSSNPSFSSYLSQPTANYAFNSVPRGSGAANYNCVRCSDGYFHSVSDNINRSCVCVCVCAWPILQWIFPPNSWPLIPVQSSCVIWQFIISVFSVSK